jgi:hypothetical protein
MHLTEDQCKREGIPITIKMLVAQSLFVLNAMTTVGESTPYNAVLGRQPAILPPLADPTAADGAGDSADGRREARIREIAVNSMTQASAMARVSRANSAKSSSSTQGKYQSGDLVDYRRQLDGKDVSPWHGPVPVIKDSPSEGTVTLKLGDGREHPYRYQDVRHTLLVMFTFFEGGFSTAFEAAKLVQKHVEALKVGTVETYGLVQTREGTMRPTKHTQDNPAVAAAVAHAVRNNLLYDNCCAVRLAHGTRRLGNFPGASGSLLLWWWPENRSKVQAEESDAKSANLLRIIGDRTDSACVMQILYDDSNEFNIANAVNQQSRHVLDHDDQQQAQSQDATPVRHEGSADHDQLSTIEEEDVNEQHLWHILETYFTDRSHDIDEKQLEVAVRAVCSDSSTAELFKDVEVTLPSYVPPQYDDFNHTIYTYCHYLEAGVNTDSYATPHAFDATGNPVVEICFSRAMSKCMLDDSDMADDEVCVLQIFATNAQQRKTVIERDTDLLTQEELWTHRPAIEASILEELSIWVKFATFARHWRTNRSQNIMTSRFVAKWKFVTDANGQRRRIIRMRMTIRGFQDWFAHLDENYSATASRQSQRIVCSECACHPEWLMVTIDIEKAFLQGMTYKEIQEATGEPERVILFSLPPGAAALLRKLPGFEDFDERFECLRALKPGTGTKGAPRAFSMKLSRITRGPKCRMLPTTMDPELEVRHDGGKLVAIGTKHVDDLKFGAEPKLLKDAIIPALEAEFGKLSYSESNFTNTGVRHKRLKDGTVTLDQDEYIAALKPINSPEMIGAPGDRPASDRLAELYRSLLGAAAYFLITQFWLMVYIVSLQRKLKAPLLIHVRRLNAVVRVAQKRAATIVYQAMKPTDVLETHSDSGFSKEQESGYGIRGANFLRQGISLKDGSPVIHLLDSQCRSHKHVTRCSFSSETRAAVIAADETLALAMSLHEVRFGALSALEARQVRDEGLCRIQTVLTVDSMSLWSAVAAQVVRVPTEKNLAVHLFWLKELLTTGALTTLRWCDTRDMSADCHTKGSIDRAAILQLMKGFFQFKQAIKDFTALRKKAKYDPRQCGQATGDHPFAHWRQQILGLYRKHAPHQLERFEEIMTRHSGREALLHRALLDKYEGRTKSSCDNRDLPWDCCRYCGLPGHWGNDCPSRVRDPSATTPKLKPAAEASVAPMPPWRQKKPKEEDCAADPPGHAYGVVACSFDRADRDRNPDDDKSRDRNPDDGKSRDRNPGNDKNRDWNPESHKDRDWHPKNQKARDWSHDQASLKCKRTLRPKEEQNDHGDNSTKRRKDDAAAITRHLASGSVRH